MAEAAPVKTRRRRAVVSSVLSSLPLRAVAAARARTNSAEHPCNWLQGTLAAFKAVLLSDIQPHSSVSVVNRDVRCVDCTEGSRRDIIW